VGNLYCSISTESIVADLRLERKHSIHFFSASFSSEEDLYQIFDTKLLAAATDVDRLVFTSIAEPAYLIRTEDIPLFKEKNPGPFLFRSLELDNTQSVVYKLPAISSMLLSFNISTYYIPSLEVMKQAIEKQSDRTVEQAFLLAFLTDGVLHIYFYARGENKVATYFECERPSDALYYTLLVLKEQGFQAEDVQFVPAGRGAFYDEAYRLWKQYLSPRDDFFNNEEGRKYFDLKALISCE
jgi:hypothetical protein